jgi:hypothetical protein
MILYLEDVLGLSAEDLLAKADKRGNAAARGPIVQFESTGTPLQDLETGQKLHVVGTGNGQTVAGHTPRDLVKLLVRLGLQPTARLKQIHLIAHGAGLAGADSFASRFSAALVAGGLQVDEIKAPLGDVRCDANGKIWLKLADATSWQPSSSALNYYCGPSIQSKHQPPAELS